MRDETSTRVDDNSRHKPRGVVILLLGKNEDWAVVSLHACEVVENQDLPYVQIRRADEKGLPLVGVVAKEMRTEGVLHLEKGWNA